MLPLPSLLNPSPRFFAFAYLLSHAAIGSRQLLDVFRVLPFSTAAILFLLNLASGLIQTLRRREVQWPRKALSPSTAWSLLRGILLGLQLTVDAWSWLKLPLGIQIMIRLIPYPIRLLFHRPPNTSSPPANSSLGGISTKILHILPLLVVGVVLERYGKLDQPCMICLIFSLAIQELDISWPVWSRPTSAPDTVPGNTLVIITAVVTTTLLYRTPLASYHLGKRLFLPRTHPNLSWALLGGLAAALAHHIREPPSFQASGVGKTTSQASGPKPEDSAIDLSTLKEEGLSVRASTTSFSDSELYNDWLIQLASSLLAIIAATCAGPFIDVSSGRGATLYSLLGLFVLVGLHFLAPQFQDEGAYSLVGQEDSEVEGVSGTRRLSSWSGRLIIAGLITGTIVFSWSRWIAIQTNLIDYRPWWDIPPILIDVPSGDVEQHRDRDLALGNFDQLGAPNRYRRPKKGHHPRSDDQPPSLHDLPSAEIKAINDILMKSWDDSDGTPQLEMVVSYYNEPLDGLKAMIDAVKREVTAYPFTRYTVYHKGLEQHVSERDEQSDGSGIGARSWEDHLTGLAEVDRVKSGTGCDRVVVKKNIGRDMGTYLDYIIDNYNNLPYQVIFVQGHIAFDYEFDERLKLVNERVGFLSFGHYLTTLNGQDQWGNGDYPYLARIWESFHSDPFPTTEPLLATYHGQFMVSRERILMAPKQKYVELRRVLMSGVGDDDHVDGWSYKGVQEGPRNPFFSHVLERGWTIMFHCTDPRKEDECWLERPANSRCLCPDR